MSLDLTGAGKRAPDRDRRAEILAAAERAFVRNGFHGASMALVADEAGMSAGNLYRYFPSKEAMVEGLCMLDQEERAASFAALASAPSVFEAMAHGLRQHLLCKPAEKAAMILEVWAEGARNPRIAEMGRAIDADVTAGLTKVFEAAKMNGEAHASLDPAFAARVVYTLVSGLFRRIAHESAFDVEAEAAMMLGVVRALFDGALRPVQPASIDAKEAVHA